MRSLIWVLVHVEVSSFPGDILHYRVQLGIGPEFELCKVRGMSNSLLNSQMKTTLEAGASVIIISSRDFSTCVKDPLPALNAPTVVLGGFCISWELDFIST
jgi:hypothetical protein